MLNRSKAQNNTISYKPLPQIASHYAFNSLTQLGFAQNAIVEEYKFSSKTNNIIKINALVFAHPSQRDLDEYASITMVNAVNGHDDKALVSLLAESSAPFHLIHRENKFSFWASGIKHEKQKNRKANLQPEPIPVKQSIPYEQLGDVLNNYAADLKPQRIIDVKQGRDIFKLFPGVNPLQLSLWAEEIRSKPLIQHFERAINLLRNHPEQLSHDTITLIATQLLGLLILADTGKLGNEARLDRPSLSTLLSLAHKSFPHYFHEHLLLRHSEAVEQAYNVLQHIQYSGFVPDMLGDLYKVSYEPKVRKNLGNYDTPLHLTRRILDTIPIEYLPPHERVIADFTCGWGSFLIAGHERLTNLSDLKEMDLPHCLYGNDFDTFFSQLAKLGLMHTTSKDDWHIDNEDVFQNQKLKDIQPNIIVGNPPFAGSRKNNAPEGQGNLSNIQKNHGKRQRFEKANLFLEHAIDQLKPGGYLALVMPRSFTVSEAGPATRKKLLETCTILELWETPRQIFKGVSVRTIVIFAQKKLADEQGKPSQACVRTRTIQPITFERFEVSGTYTASALITDQSKWHSTMWQSESEKSISHVFNYTTILSTSTWSEIEKHCAPLIYCAERTRGITTSTKKRDWNSSSEVIPLLPNVDDIMQRSYILNYARATELLYPDYCLRPRLKNKHIFKKPKILLQYVQEPSWGNRVKLAIERKGYYVSEHYYAIVAKQTLWMPAMSNEALAAILEWDVSNAWIIEHMKSPSIPSHVVDTIPIPSNLEEKDCTALANAFLILEKEANLGLNTSLEFLNARDVIDNILFNAYNLDNNTFKRLRQVRYWDRKPLVTLDAQPDLIKANWFTSGIVHYVDAGKGKIEIWIDGFDELQKVDIVPSMPGWLLHPGVAFLTMFPIEYARKEEIDRDTTDWGYFRPQPYMYMSEDELLKGISQHFSTQQSLNSI